MKKIIIFTLLFTFCSSENIETVEDTSVETTIAETIEPDNTSTTTSIEVTQLESFEEALYVVNKDLSSVSYLAPKQFLNSGLDIVEGTTREIIGRFTLTLAECDQADSCLYVKDLQIKADISTLKSNNIIRDQAINNQWLQSTLFPEAIFTIDELVLPNKDLDGDQIFISGITEIDTTWFGFDAPTKFNAWEVLNPIGIKVSIVAEK